MGDHKKDLSPPTAQISNVKSNSISLFESDTQIKILKSKLELATGPGGISEFFWTSLAI